MGVAVAAAILVVGCSSSSQGVADGRAADRTDVTFATRDGKNLTGYLSVGQSPAGSPGVVLIHQFGQTDEQWGDLPEVLAARGYRVLAFNLRGHGDSDPYDGALVGLLDDAAAGSADLDAALGFIAAAGAADPQRIAVIGTSIGANLAVAAAIGDKAHTYVSLSARRAKAENYAGAAATGLRSVFYFASADDSNGDQAADASEMFDATAEPRQLKIYEGTADHGIAILRNQADARELVLGWLAANL